MRPFSATLLALGSLRGNAIRSILTILGVMIGVASVVTNIAIGEGAEATLRDQIRAFGVNVMMVESAPTQRNGVVRGRDDGRKLDDEDLAAIAGQRGVVAAAPVIGGNIQVIRGNRNWPTFLVGTTDAQFAVRDWQPVRGRLFHAEELERAGKVVVLGASIATKLFADEDPVGQTVRVFNEPLRVIGVLDRKGPMGNGQDQDDVAFVPIETARQRLVGGANVVARQSLAYILVKADPDRAEDVKAGIGVLLRARHHLGGARADDFRITDPVAALRAQQSSMQTLTILLALLASVSLVVGGVSVMNMMLVTVRERTREIGLRIALGARRRDIRGQFLTEAVVLCLLGGVVGVAVGVAATGTLSALAGWRTLISTNAILLPLSFCTAVGMIFGLYPAHRAARLDPVAALRSD